MTFRAAHGPIHAVAYTADGWRLVVDQPIAGRESEGLRELVWWDLRSRAALRRFFEVDAEFITLATLDQLARRGDIKPARVEKAIKELGIDPEKLDPLTA